MRKVPTRCVFGVTPARRIVASHDFDEVSCPESEPLMSVIDAVIAFVCRHGRVTWR
jgi:hypothetical protein